MNEAFAPFFIGHFKNLFIAARHAVYRNEKHAVFQNGSAYVTACTLQKL
jgi:hypothetical protein